MKRLKVLTLVAILVCIGTIRGQPVASALEEVVSPASMSDTALAEEMTLLSINVRKADAHLLRCGTSAYLIDTGKKKTFDILYRVLKENDVDHLTGVILTHSHSDHTGGLKKLMESDIQVDNVYTSAYYAPKKEDKENPAVKALKDTGMEPIYLKSGDALPLDGGKLLVLGPLEEMTDPDHENSNSLVLLASGGGGTILLTGDMEFPEEEILLDAQLIPHADVLKIGNHGEGDATSERLIEAVSPSLAIISTNSEDEPDTPDPRVLLLLSDRGITVLETQQAKNGVLITIRSGTATYQFQ